MLTVDALDAGYGDIRVLRGLSLAVGAGEVLCLMGRNGAGKSTALKAIIGLVRPTAGTVRLQKLPLEGLPAHAIAREGVAWVPQGRRLFAELTVAENLAIGLAVRGRGARTRDQVPHLFPPLTDRPDQVSGPPSRGEPQMLAIARALCVRPRVLLLDEPTEGLQPSIAAQIREVVLGLRGSEVAILLVEQRVEAALATADRIAFVANGTIAETLATAGLAPDAPAFRTWVGV
jgi:branched-chain amino acid transport system ATP-binding protein